MARILIMDAVYVKELLRMICHMIILFSPQSRVSKRKTDMGLTVILVCFCSGNDEQAANNRERQWAAKREGGPGKQEQDWWNWNETWSLVLGSGRFGLFMHLGR